MVLRNYVELVTGRPSLLHFTAGEIVSKTITDPLTRQAKAVNTLILTTDELDGQPCSCLLSVTSEKLAVQLYPFIEKHSLGSYNFRITAIGEGFARTYSVEVTPR